MSTRDEARRRAEESLTFMDAALLDEMPPLPTQVKALADAVRALLAAEPEAVVCDGHGETYDEVYRDRERLRESVEIERDGQRSMVRALAEIHRLSRLDVAISLASDAPSPARDEVREAAEKLRRLALQGAIDAPEVLDEINSLLAALSRPAPAPAVPPAVREAAERADKAMRDVFGGVDRFGDYCGHPMIPGKLAHAVAALLAALGGKLEGKGGAS